MAGVNPIHVVRKMATNKRTTATNKADIYIYKDWDVLAAWDLDCS